MPTLSLIHLITAFIAQEQKDEEQSFSRFFEPERDVSITAQNVNQPALKQAWQLAHGRNKET